MLVIPAQQEHSHEAGFDPPARADARYLPCRSTWRLVSPESQVSLESTHSSTCGAQSVHCIVTRTGQVEFRNSRQPRPASTPENPTTVQAPSIRTSTTAHRTLTGAPKTKLAGSPRHIAALHIYTAMAHAPPLRVLCFGNSLTSGYHAWGTGSHPYSIVLSARLRDAFPGRRIEVTTSGVPGDVVCGPAFHERMSRECKSPASFPRASVFFF